MEFGDRCHVCDKHRGELDEIPWGTKIKNDDGSTEWGIICKPCKEKEIQDRIANYDWDELSTSFESNVICPHCGEVHEPDTESSEFYEDGNHVFLCQYCCSGFNLETNISISYTTTKIEEEE